MKLIYDNFIKFLYQEDKENSVNFILDKVKNNEIHIVSLYTEVLTPALNNIDCTDSNFCIWKEHVRSSIIRTIIECCYPYVIKERNEKYKLKTNKKVLVLCPSEEYHELGARMSADFFTLLGYNCIFIGGNTPKEDFLKAINSFSPNYIAISVTNYFNLVAAKKSIDLIKEVAKTPPTILVGGNAFKNNSMAYKKVGADLYINSFEDILQLRKEELK